MTDATDLDALHRAFDLTAAEPGRTEHLAAMLAERPWVEVAEFAAYDRQMDSLRLKPWEAPPCWGPASGPGAKLLARMLAAGVSQWEPDPLAALAKKRRRK